METPKKDNCRKNDYQKVAFEHKLFVIDQINNGQISANFASKKYNIPRSSIHYWMEKLSSYASKKAFISKDDEIRNLKRKVSELECIKEFQQDVIIEFEKITGEELSKKYLPESLSNPIQRRKKKLSK
jgi:hypothetical protein